jgi:hypothetical protein
MKKITAPKKLIVAKETIRALERRELPTAAGGMRPPRWLTAASGQDACCA